jgi:hypothetical protein
MTLAFGMTIAKSKLKEIKKRIFLTFRLKRSREHYAETRPFKSPLLTVYRATCSSVKKATPCFSKRKIESKFGKLFYSVIYMVSSWASTGIPLGAKPVSLPE